MNNINVDKIIRDYTSNYNKCEEMYKYIQNPNDESARAACAAVITILQNLESTND